MKCEKKIFKKDILLVYNFISLFIKIIEIGICRNMLCDTSSLSNVYQCYAILSYLFNDYKIFLQ